MVSGVKLSMLLKYEKQSMAQERTTPDSCVCGFWFKAFAITQLVVIWHSAQGSMYIVS